MPLSVFRRTLMTWTASKGYRMGYIADDSLHGLFCSWGILRVGNQTVSALQIHAIPASSLAALAIAPPQAPECMLAGGHKKGPRLARSPMRESHRRSYAVDCWIIASAVCRLSRLSWGLAHSVSTTTPAPPLRSFRMLGSVSCWRTPHGCN